MIAALVEKQPPPPPLCMDLTWNSFQFSPYKITCISVDNPCRTHHRNICHMLHQYSQLAHNVMSGEKSKEVTEMMLRLWFMIHEMLTIKHVWDKPLVVSTSADRHTTQFLISDIRNSTLNIPRLVDGLAPMKPEQIETLKHIEWDGMGCGFWLGLWQYKYIVN